MIDLPWLRKRGNFFLKKDQSIIIIIIKKRKSSFVTDSNWLVELYRLAAIQLPFFFLTTKTTTTKNKIIIKNTKQSNDNKQ